MVFLAASAHPFAHIARYARSTMVRIRLKIPIKSSGNHFKTGSYSAALMAFWAASAHPFAHIARYARSTRAGINLKIPIKSSGNHFKTGSESFTFLYRNKGKKGIAQCQQSSAKSGFFSAGSFRSLPFPARKAAVGDDTRLT